jgi:hypothetical protein
MDYNMKKKDNIPATLTNGIRTMIMVGNNEGAEMIMKNMNLTLRVQEFMYISVFYGNLEMIKFLEEEGGSLKDVPKTLKPEGDKTDEAIMNYREIPYLILAASRGHL